MARCAAGLPFVFKEGMQVHVVPPLLEMPRVLTVADAEPTGPDGGIVWFEELANANDAKPYVGRHCLASRAEVDEAVGVPEAFDSELDLRGWEVFEADEGFVGLVKELREMPGQLMLVIDDSSCEEILVPLVDEFVSGIDEDGKTLHLTLPDGLLRL